MEQKASSKPHRRCLCRGRSRGWPCGLKIAAFGCGQSPRPSSAEDLGWRYLNPRGSYSATCSRDFPIQGDVAPKVETESKTFMSKTIEGVQCSHTLGRKPILIVIKVLGFLRGFFKIPLSRCGQSPRPLEPIGWWASAVRLGTRFLFRENFHLHTTIFLYRGNVTFRQRI